MNLAIVSAFSALFFFLAKMAINYTEMNPKSYIQDSVLAFATCLAGIYAYNTYLDKPITAKVPVVFTERPNF